MNGFNRKPSESALYITDTFQAKQCSCCQPLSSSSRKSVPRAFVDRFSTDYDGFAAEVQYKKTDAFGSIQFLPMHPGYQKKAKYVRLADDTDPESVLDFMKNQWKLLDTLPDLVISVIGGGKHFQLSDSRKKEIFNQGLVKAIHATKGWLLTFGFNYGIGKAVGAAVQEGQAFMVKNNRELVNYIQCIGITPWGGIKGREELVNPDTSVPFDATYYADGEAVHGQPNSLEPNHSHFLLVDDGHCNKESGTAQFRTALEKQISKPTEEGGQNVPVVCVLVEGGIFSVQSVCDSLNNDLPVLVCKGTDRAADLIAHYHEKIGRIKHIDDALTRSQKLTELIEAVRHKLTTLKGNDSNKEVENEAKLAARLINTCFDKYTLISIFDIEKSEDLDVSILFCLMKSRRDRDVLSQLNLAQKWNRADVARNFILKSHRPFKNRQDKFDPNFNRLFLGNLIADRVEFVKLFVDKGFNVATYLTVSRLRELYRSTIGDRKSVWSLMHKRVSPTAVTLADIHQLLVKRCNHRILHKTYVDDTGNVDNDSNFVNPFSELFMWATIMGRYEMALYLWEQCSQPLLTGICGTLVCHKIGQSLSKAFECDSQEYKRLKTELEQRCVGLLNQAYESNPEKSLELIENPHSKWGGQSVLDLAALAYDQNFVASQACQFDIRSAWKRGFDATGLVVVFCTFIPFAIPSLITFAPRPVCRKRLFDDIDAQHANPEEMVQLNDQPTQLHLPVIPQKSVDSSEGRRVKKQTLFVQSYSEIADCGHDVTDGIYDSHISASDKMSELWYKIHTFYTSPVVIFILHTVAYIVFLMLYTFVALFAFRPTITDYEIVLQVWIFTLMCDEFRALLQYSGRSLKDKLREWWAFSTFSTWNSMDMAALFLAIVAFSLRWSLTTFAIARLIFVINFIIFISRSFKVYFVNSYLGPKVVMIKRMMWDLGMFLLVVVIFLLAYTVTSQSLLHPHRNFYWAIIYDLFNHGIWELFGELQDEPTSRANFVECIKNSTSTLPFECDTRWWPVPILLALYLFVGNVLMINMLIATFAHVFDEVQSNSEQIWKHEMYFLVAEYKTKPFLPPPFIILTHLWLLITCGCAKKPKIIPDESEFLAAFERVSRADYLYNRRKTESNLADNVIQSMNEKITEIANQLQTFKSELKQLRDAKPTSTAQMPDPNGGSMQVLSNAEPKVRNKLLRLPSAENEVRMSTSMPLLSQASID